LTTNDGEDLEVEAETVIITDGNHQEALAGIEIKIVQVDVIETKKEIVAQIERTSKVYCCQYVNCCARLFLQFLQIFLSIEGQGQQEDWEEKPTSSSTLVSPDVPVKLASPKVHDASIESGECVENSQPTKVGEEDSTNNSTNATSTDAALSYGFGYTDDQQLSEMKSMDCNEANFSPTLNSTS